VLVLDRLVEDLSDPQLVASVVRTYLRELPPRVAAIERALAADDREALEAAAHVLRSTSAAVGATDLAERCRTLEVRGAAVGPADGDAVRRESEVVQVALSRQLEDLLDAGRVSTPPSSVG
jgi:HPt (histidine-containing phosphotransfer) domain-containing protein